MGELGRQYQLKSLIPVADRLILDWALSSLPDSFFTSENIQLGFILRSDLPGSLALRDWIMGRVPSAQFHWLSAPTRGPLESVELVLPKLESDSPLLVMDGDLLVQAPDFFSHVERKKTGALLSFPSDRPQYSYVMCDDQRRALRVAEKRVISERALAGTYFFSKVQHLQVAASQILQEGGHEEYFLSHAVDRLIKEGESFEVFDLEKHVSFGTFDEALAAPLGGALL